MTSSTMSVANGHHMKQLFSDAGKCNTLSPYQQYQTVAVVTTLHISSEFSIGH